MGRHHPVHRAVFHGNQVNLVHKAAAVLVGEIAPPPRAALLDPGHHLAPRGPCARALLLLAEAALGRDERRRCFPEEAWVGKRRLGAEPGEGLEAPSLPTCCPACGSGDGAAHAHEQPTYHLPVRLRARVAVLGVPSQGRW